MNEINVLAVDDEFGMRTGIERTLSHFKLQLPDLEETINCQIDLQLSGHTHNGQFFPINWFVKKMYENSYGYLKKNNTHIYVTSGLGIWGPQYRIGTQSELVVIEFGY